MKRRSAVAALALALVAGGCGEERVDSQQGDRQSHVDRSPAEVLAMPDAFRNVASKCDGHGHRVYSNSTGDSGDFAELAVIDDTTCPKGDR